MCMNYVNASARCYKAITTVDNNVVSYDIPFSSIRHDNRGLQTFIGEFSIVTDIDILGTNNAEHKSVNPLESRKTLSFIVRLTKCSSDESKRIGYDLDCFSIDLEELYETNQMGKACYDFLNYTRITNIDSLELPGGAGKYVIKVLIKDSEDEDYTIQAMTQLTVI